VIWSFECNAWGSFVNFTTDRALEFKYRFFVHFLIFFLMRLMDDINWLFSSCPPHLIFLPWFWSKSFLRLSEGNEARLANYAKIRVDLRTLSPPALRFINFVAFKAPRPKWPRFDILRVELRLDPPYIFRWKCPGCAKMLASYSWNGCDMNAA
jgi:hypothetical protein